MNSQQELSQASIRYVLLWDSGERRELVVEVENRTRAVIPRLYVQWRYERGTPEAAPAADDSLPLEPGGGTILEPQAEGETSSLSSDLTPGRTCRFNARPGTVDRMLDRAAALDATQYWISLQAQGKEFARIPGAELKQFLDAAPSSR